MKIGATLASVVILTATAGFAVFAQAQGPNEVNVSGCPLQGVENNCLVIKGSDGTTYDISSAKPRPKVGYLGINLKGVKSDKVGICMQGPILEKIKWYYTKQSCR
jgi:hypothetical protein